MRSKDTAIAILSIDGSSDFPKLVTAEFGMRSCENTADAII